MKLIFAGITSISLLFVSYFLTKDANEAFEQKQYDRTISILDSLRNDLGYSSAELQLNSAHSYFLQKNNLEKADSVYTSLNDSLGKIASIASLQLGNIFVYNNIDTSNIQAVIQAPDSEEKLRTALDYYAQALRSNEYNEEARYNYELLSRVLSILMNEDQENKDQNKQDQNQQDDQKDQQNKDQENQDQKDQGDKDQQQGGEDQQSQDGKGDESSKEQGDPNEQQGEGEEGDESSDEKDAQNEQSKSDNGKGDEAEDKKGDQGKSGQSQDEGKPEEQDQAQQSAGDKQQGKEGDESQQPQGAQGEMSDEQKEALRQQAIMQALKEEGLTQEQAEQLLNSYDGQEQKYIQFQKKRRDPEQSTDSNKPDW